MEFVLDSDDGLSSAMGTETLAAHDFGKGTITPAIATFNPIAWWAQELLPSIRQWAFDTLSCPAISCECERVFSSAKKLITPERNALGDDLIEALECLKAWWDHGFVQRG